MPEIKIADNVFAPAGRKTLNYKGKEPFNVVEMINTEMRLVYGVARKDIITQSFMWDTTGDPRSFFVKLRTDHKLDRWTKCTIWFIVQGEQFSRTKEGHFTFILKPTLFTKIEYTNFLQKDLWWIYDRWFYHSQRQKYIERELLLADRFLHDLREQLGIQHGERELP